WAEVLRVERVGRHDNFFELGGHSLLAVQVAALLANRYACEIPVRTFFDVPTLQAFASRLPTERLLGSGSRTNRLTQMDILMSEFEV
ncbi:phosphopantetheine-binding protein, partial [Acidovorax facilis]